MTAKQSYKLILLCIFILFFAVSSNTPMHSDDFNYAMKGMSLEQHWMHYIGWSGRVISDYISTFVLSFQSLYIKAAITALAATLLIHFISSIFRINRDRTIKDCAILITVFFLYWLCHPALGESTFWVVGASNYLWTNLFIVIYLYLLSNIVSDDNNPRTPVILTFAFLAGCTNENTGLIPVTLTIIAAIVMHRKKGRNRNICIASFSFCLAGYLILILSPGNGVRASFSSAYYAIPLTERFFYHLQTRLTWYLRDMWIIAAFLIISLFFIVTSKRLRALNISVFLLLVCAAVMSCVIMFVSPIYPARASTGAFIILLIAISIGIRSFRFRDAYLLAIPVILIPSFVTSYSNVISEYIKSMAENEIRLQVINSSKDDGLSDFSIPTFSFHNIIKPSTRFDMWHNPKVYGRYFGVDSINSRNVEVDYSVIKTGPEYPFHLDLENGSELISYYISDEGYIYEVRKPAKCFNNMIGGKGNAGFLFSIGTSNYFYSKIKPGNLERSGHSFSCN
ncbi:DUF6056 family protein [Enterobacter hormaechei]|uniref:DUF6056 family protein n=3 Tax=Enterobacter hormaechei TaxID=158836 RepID=UPI001BD410DB|nr:DUF6056 family protein [Enterobacter hormaechei]